MSISDFGVDPFDVGPLRGEAINHGGALISACPDPGQRLLPVFSRRLLVDAQSRRFIGQTVFIDKH
ncbi:hypothetical protein BST24_21470 [Mycobacteroides franklinii]|nr:hypothetical protein BST24_21470 [Mycobacteroides franklinii]